MCEIEIRCVCCQLVEVDVDCLLDAFDFLGFVRGFIAPRAGRKYPGRRWKFAGRCRFELQFPHYLILTEDNIGQPEIARADG